VAAELLAAAREHLGTTARAVHVHRWRYAAPTGRAEVPAVRDDTPGAPLLLAGDGLTGGRVEGAAVSGLAAARLLRTG
jgi:renalase